MKPNYQLFAIMNNLPILLTVLVMEWVQSAEEPSFSEKKTMALRLKEKEVRKTQIPQFTFMKQGIHINHLIWCTT